MVGGIITSFVWGLLFWGYLYDPLEVYANFSTEMKEAARILIQRGLPGTNLMLGILHCFIVTCLALILCGITHQVGQSPWRNFRIILVAGMMGSIYCQLDGPIWFLLPWKHSSMLLFYDFGSWLIMGLVFVFSLSNPTVMSKK